MTYSLRRWVLLGTVICSAASAAPIPVVDVDNSPNGYMSYIDLQYYTYQQSFTVGTTGLLSGMAFYGATALGTNNATALRIKIGGSGWITGDWDFEYMRAVRMNGSVFDLTPYDLHVNVGDNVIFEVGHSYGAIWVGRYGLGAPLYQLHNNHKPSNYSLMVDRSLGFTSYVIADANPADPGEPTPVSAPGTASLFGLGLGMLGVAGFTRRRKDS